MASIDSRFSRSQLEERRPVWDALSTMYLDTDVSLSREWRIRILSASPYSLDEIEGILRDEVRPVCLPNLLHPAGEWAGFDLGWLEQAIRDCRRNWLSKLLARVGQRLFGDGTGGEWNATRQGIAVLRSRGRGAQE